MNRNISTKQKLHISLPKFKRKVDHILVAGQTSPLRAGGDLTFLWEDGTTPYALLFSTKNTEIPDLVVSLH